VARRQRRPIVDQWRSPWLAVDGVALTLRERGLPNLTKETIARSSRDIQTWQP